MATEDVAPFGPAGRFVHGTDGAAICYWIIGVTETGKWTGASGDAMARMAAQPPNHSAEFAPDPRALGIGIQAMISAALAGFS